MNLMASGKVPVPVATFLAGGRLIALNKGKEGNPPDVRPIAVGETLRSGQGNASVPSKGTNSPQSFSPHNLEWLVKQVQRRLCTA